jgi:putative membrane protein insertion efficiency factor
MAGPIADPPARRRGIGAALDQAAARVLVALVVAYKWTLSPLLGRHCRFEPSCSAYFRGAVEKHGALRGAVRGVRRVCRCHPWNPGGYDPP